MDHKFNKIQRLPPYVFAEVNAMKAKARFFGEDIIDFGMGNPDQPPAPKQYQHLGLVEFSKLLLDGVHVVVAPGIGFSEHCDGHVRFSLVEMVQRIRQVIRNIKIFLNTKIPDLSLELRL